MRKVAVVAVLLLSLILTAGAAQADSWFEFSSDKKEDFGYGEFSKYGNWSTNASLVTDASTPGDFVLGTMGGFSDFNIWDAIDAHWLEYGQTYEVLDSFTLPYYNNQFLLWADESDLYKPSESNAYFGGKLSLDTITIAEDGYSFTLTGSLSDLWLDNSIDSLVLQEIVKSGTAEFSLTVAANKDIVKKLNSKKGGIKTWTETGRISASSSPVGGTPEPGTMLLLGSALPVAWAWRRRWLHGRKRAV